MQPIHMAVKESSFVEKRMEKMKNYVACYFGHFKTRSKLESALKNDFLSYFRFSKWEL